MAKDKGSSPIGSIVGAVGGFLLARWLGWVFFIPFLFFIGLMVAQYAIIKEEHRRHFIFYTTFTWTHVLAGSVFLLLGVASGQVVWNAEIAGNAAELFVMAGLAGFILWKPRIWLVVLSLVLKALLLMAMLDFALPSASFTNPEGQGIIFNIAMRAGALIALIYGGHQLYYSLKEAGDSASASQADPSSFSAASESMASAQSGAFESASSQTEASSNGSGLNVSVAEVSQENSPGSTRGPQSNSSAHTFLSERSHLASSDADEGREST
tara:strand:+ start:41380 stop:42183 length:804 start_codon:yes stop_codon:yes gene_type:complete